MMLVRRGFGAFGSAASDQLNAQIVTAQQAIAKLQAEIATGAIDVGGVKAAMIQGFQTQIANLQQQLVAMAQPGTGVNPATGQYYPKPQAQPAVGMSLGTKAALVLGGVGLVALAWFTYEADRPRHSSGGRLAY